MPRNNRYSSLAPISSRLPLTTPGQKIGLMGGTFDPPHQGHATIARTALKRLGLSQVWWLVTPGNPLKSRPLPPTAKRIEACRRLAPERTTVVTDVEVALETSYTIDTLRLLLSRLPGRHFVWIMGADNLATFDRWQGWRSIMSRVPIAVIDRPGWTLKALQSRAATAATVARHPESRAKLLANLPPPAWIFLSARHSAASSTALRARFGREGGEIVTDSNGPKRT